MAVVMNKKIGSTGFGMMSLASRTNSIPMADAIDILRDSLAKGANFWNGGVFYGTPEYNSVHILHAYFTQYPEDASKVVISIKGGFDATTRTVNGTKDFIRNEAETAFKVLDGKCQIDIFQCGRVDPKVPIEDTIGELVELVKEGKIGGIGVSECSAKSIRRAAKVHPIAAVEVEFSLFATEILENGVAETCAELGIPIIAYSPLARGLLAGQFKRFKDIPEGDVRRISPRFQPGNFEKNLKLVEEVEKLASQKGCTTGNIAMAWVKSHSGRNGMPEIIPIPGTKTREHLAGNMIDIELSEADLVHLDQAVKNCTVHGGRYPPAIEALNWG